MRYRDKEWLKEQFDKYKTVSSVANNTGYPRTCITRYALKYNIYQSKYNRNKNNNINEDYFKTIDTSAKAYLLGFIMADGNMYLKANGSYQFSLKVKDTDVDILEKLAKATSFNADKIKDVKGIRKNTITKSKSMKTYNNQFCLNLVDKGIIPNKSGKESMPSMNKDIKKDFIRGFLDGDGWIGKDRNRVGIASMSKDIMHDIINYIQEELDISVSLHQDKNLWRFDIYKKETVYKILKHLYYKDCISLNRKYDLAINTMSRIEKSYSVGYKLG